jgi:hypothetical protein
MPLRAVKLTLGGVLLVPLLAAPAALAGTINPHPRATVSRETAARWDFEASPDGWSAVNDSRLETAGGILRVTSTGADPYIHRGGLEVEASVVVSMRLRSSAAGPGEVFWVANEERATGAGRSRRFEITHDGEWREYAVKLPLQGTLRELRLDPGSAPGLVEIDWIRLETRLEHPLEVTRLETTEALEREGVAAAWVKNHSASALAFLAAGRPYRAGAGEEVRIEVPLGPAARPFEAVTVRVEAEGLPPAARVAVVHRPGAPGEWVRLEDGALSVEVAADGSGARVLRSGALAALVAPFFWDGERLPRLSVTRRDGAVALEGEGGERAELSLAEGAVIFRFEAPAEREGPVVRAPGGLEQGLLAGVEHLGRGEPSSSTVDIEGPEHLRFAPPPRHLTMPLMAFVTDRASVAMTWADTSLRPVFATPNFFDGALDHRLAIRGRRIEAAIRIGGPFSADERLEEAILWALARHGGLPPVPAPPRPAEEGAALSLRAFEKSVIRAGEGNWYHAVVPGGRTIPESPQPFSDHVSAIFRLTGKVPEVPRLAHGGAHIEDNAAYFLSGRAREWLEASERRARDALGRQEEDGSFRYRGPMARGHFEDTASGLSAREALHLLEHARFTGSKESLDAAVKTLEFARRFRTPRGAQTWECPLHAPDLLAAAYLVRAYVLGHELTGEERCLRLAARWALSGVPYVYLWSDRPLMLYATTPTLCATHWKAPVWIGLPVQWVGLVYADALLDLAPRDRTLDWRRLAHGILAAAEAMQYPDGPSVGCLPDVFDLERQARLPADINPCAIVSLRLRLEGRPVGLSVATLPSGRRVVAPFPVTVEGGAVRLEAREGLRYQILAGGEALDIISAGRDSVQIER